MFNDKQKQRILILAQEKARQIDNEIRHESPRNVNELMEERAELSELMGMVSLWIREPFKL